MKNNDYLSLETAKMLKEVGLPQGGGDMLSKPKWGDYSQDGSLSTVYFPHLYEAQRWLREEYMRNINIYHAYDEIVSAEMWAFVLSDFQCDEIEADSGFIFSTYELALDAAIQEACKIIIRNNDIMTSVPEANPIEDIRHLMERLSKMDIEKERLKRDKLWVDLFKLMNPNISDKLKHNIKCQ